VNLQDSAPAAVPLREAFERQRRARDTLPPLSHADRIAALLALERMLTDCAAELCKAVDADFQGRAEQETRLLELFPAMEAAHHARRHLRAWMKPRRHATSKWFVPGRSRVIPQALGVVGIVVPWNYPIYLALAPAVSALAAGNRILVKMSEAAPRTGELLARLIAARFDPAVARVINGGPEVAREFVALPFDHLLFTGSTAVGREVMRAASENLTPVTLELGGKSPAIVGRGIDAAEAAAKIMFGKCLNAGQTCVAPDYALVPQERLEDFIAAARAAVGRMYPSLAANRQYSAIVNERQRARLRGWIDEARQSGARVEEINPAGEDFSASPKIAPHIVAGAAAHLRLMREEIFGPVLPVVGYGELSQAIAYVNERPRPLALYVFDHDKAAIERVLAETVSGGATVNETLLHIAQEDLPFGGVGASGMGEYHGRAGFDTFSKRKAVFFQPRLNLLGLFRPPYGPRFERLMKLLAR
jgi:coniferyl-aldehyde dehydrogenase